MTNFKKSKSESERIEESSKILQLLFLEHIFNICFIKFIVDFYYLLTVAPCVL